MNLDPSLIHISEVIVNGAGNILAKSYRIRNGLVLDDRLLQYGEY